MPLSRTRSRAGRNLGNWYSVSYVTTGKCVTGIPTVPTGTVTTAAVSATASIPPAPAAGAGAGALTSRIGGVACQDNLDCREVDRLVLRDLSRSCDVECELGTYGDDRTVVSVGDR